MDYDRGLAAQAQRLTPFRPWNETTQLLLPVEAHINETRPFGRGVVGDDEMGWMDVLGHLLMS